MFDTFHAVLEKLQANQTQFEVIEHPAEGRCEKISAIRGDNLHQAAKAILLRVAISKKEGVYVLGVLPADCNVNFDAIADVYHVSKGAVRLAAQEKVKELTGCEIGAVPPFALSAKPLSVIVDPSIYLDSQEIFFNAGVLDKSIKMPAVDYKKIIDAEKTQNDKGWQIVSFAVKRPPAASVLSCISVQGALFSQPAASGDLPSNGASLLRR